MRALGQRHEVDFAGAVREPLDDEQTTELLEELDRRGASPREASSSRNGGLAALPMGRITCHHGVMAEQAHFKLSGAISAISNVVTDRLTGGELTLVPDTSAEPIRERAGLPDPMPEQAQAFWRENEPHMLPPDDEP
jgi:hypothetical protein